MAKRIKIIGNCAFCKRAVGADMRPINEITEDKEEFMKDFETAEQALQESSQPSTASNSSDVFTNTMLGLVKDAFERPLESKERISKENAEFIMSMLAQEGQKSIQQKSSKPRKR
ncbi:uncharacterized protein LOC108600608 [Drosophila busckii]|uniref:uncharacterized protein LOC108600608 n=1 Tax=Drosophila busckii TaxID=30019 RepID=UPI00083F4F2C|nr:uncharacterized protein LOC108600608 [Drosophila busckii]